MSSNNPIPLLYSGQAGTYYGTDEEALPHSAPPDLHQAGQWLEARDFRYLGHLTCSQFASVEVYAYATPDGKIAVSLMKGSMGLGGIDFVSKFADEAYLTTTNVRVLPNAYRKQKLFFIPLPGANLEQLFDAHLAGIRDFEWRYGDVQAGFFSLRTVAWSVDEHTFRRQSRFGHRFIVFFNACCILLSPRAS